MLRELSAFFGFYFSLVIFVFNGSGVLALGASPVISHIKTGETSAATREYIDVYNNSEQDIDITGWCIYYSSASDITKTKLTCVVPPASDIKLILKSFTYIRFSSNEFKASVGGFTPDFIFSAGLSAAGGHIRLFDADNIEKDRVGWGTAVSPETLVVAAHQSGSVNTRKSIVSTKFLQDTNNNQNDFSDALLSVIPASGLVEQQIIVDQCPNIDGTQNIIPDDYFLDNGQCIQDVCDNLTGLQATIPITYESLDGLNCTLIPLEDSVLEITEILPNISGSDTGKEFIEIYNPNNHRVNLGDYKLEVGPDHLKNFIFDQHFLDPLTYVSFNDIFTKLTLPNTTASLRLIAPSGDKVSETDSYVSPPEDQSWALINNIWQFTNQLTPDAFNLISKVETPLEVDNTDTELTPCPEGKVRNPETNRCKNIESSDSLVACAQGQERNPATNRCRSTISTADALVPCKEGQERNSDTNRCRTVVSTASALVPCKENQERNSNTNRCRNISPTGQVASAKVTDIPSKPKSSNNFLAIGAIGVLLIGYGAYEWRNELTRFAKKLTKRN